MALATTILGYPRIGKNRELKKSLENYWKNNSFDLEKTASSLRAENRKTQKDLSLQICNDFSFYDQMLDTAVLFDIIPERFQSIDSPQEKYFAMARGLEGKPALEMTKWFNTNYHNLVPELSAQTTFALRPKKVLAALQEAPKARPVLIGPLTFLAKSRSFDSSNVLNLLPKLKEQYIVLLNFLADKGTTWAQLDEPLLATEISKEWQQAYLACYQDIKTQCPNIKIFTPSYFGAYHQNLELVTQLPVDAIHLDCTYASSELPQILAKINPDCILSLGLVNGRNIWINDYSESLALYSAASQKHEKLWLNTSCSLLHSPYTLKPESKLDPTLQERFSFAQEKLQELKDLQHICEKGALTADLMQRNQEIFQRWKEDPRCHRPEVRQQLKHRLAQGDQRAESYFTRSQIQTDTWDLPLYPTTTIGSFPQTTEIRLTRQAYRQGQITEEKYHQEMQRVTSECIEYQEKANLDVLVHGEFERVDMVEYFGQQLEGYCFTEYAWVQSYGSRCVKPPILFGDIQRTQPMTLDYTLYAQGLTTKPVKGMLTGPITILQWSFVREDISRKESAQQLALAIEEEVLDLEKEGIGFIQIDEPALREGLPLHQSEWQDYLDWSTQAFRLTASRVKNETQIHTHMCYGDFEDIIEAIAALDADVISLECSRSQGELLHSFETYKYPNAIGLGVWDIHSPAIPSKESIATILHKASQYLPEDRLWVNPDCGLKTRHWDEVLPSLQNMVEVAQELREENTVMLP